MRVPVGSSIWAPTAVGIARMDGRVSALEGRLHVKRLLVALTVVVVVIAGGSASGIGMTTRPDPDDSSSALDVRTVASDRGGHKSFFEVITWDDFTANDLDVSRKRYFVVALDTRGTKRFDVRLFMYHNSITDEYLCEAETPSGTTFGPKLAVEVSSTSIGCLVPNSWLGAKKPIRFAVFATYDGAVVDRAPDTGRFNGL
jgi:hypothetical protein